MTKKDYILIADALNIETTNQVERNLKVILQYRLANRLQLDNPHFDEEKFLKACDLKDKAV